MKQQSLIFSGILPLRPMSLANLRDIKSEKPFPIAYSGAQLLTNVVNYTDNLKFYCALNVSHKSLSALRITADDLLL